MLLSALTLMMLKLPGQAPEEDVAMVWNEAVLNAIRNDFARPTIHARNLFHTSIALYDTWALFDPTAETYLLGKQLGNFESTIDLSRVNTSASEAFKLEVASFAVYRIASFRFANSPGVDESQQYFDSLMIHFGYEVSELSVDYADGRASSLGNYIATEIIRWGLQDGANEQKAYANQHYTTVNEPLIVAQPGNPTITDPNRWQPLAFDLFIDQSGNVIPGSIPDFLSPEWGNVHGFTLDPSDAQVYSRDGNDFSVYKDTGIPPLLLPNAESNEAYQWGFTLVAHWAAHLDPSDGVLWDISPASIGNINSLPTTLAEYQSFYPIGGGDSGTGHTINPSTGSPYTPQIVPRGDYARVLAEFWADGPDSETPPGHWFTLLNYVMTHPLFEPRFGGDQLIADRFEYQVKAYFTLGAAMHDAAIAAWALKGWYDYVRPVSALRYMADLGQSSDPDASSYHPLGIPLQDGFVELVTADDNLAGPNDQHAGKIKLMSWRGPDYIRDEATDAAGVGWILAENWWPYQRPTFITPPFAGFVSGHSTYSRAAAEVLTLLTGDPYFPGGIGEFFAKRNEFLVFEDGPSVDITLQWATYRDASDQCSLSRIWGGIHPPADDIPGRVIGAQVGQEAYSKALSYFDGQIVLGQQEVIDQTTLFPNPVAVGVPFTVASPTGIRNITAYGLRGNKLSVRKVAVNQYILDSAGGYTALAFIRINGTIVKRLIIK